MQLELDQEIIEIVDNMSRDIDNRQKMIEELYENVKEVRASSHLRGRHEMKELVLKLLQNDALFTKIDSYIPNFIERKIYKEIIRVLILQINSLE
jgi:DNA-binding transcriptional regulator GbsR (MarR family)